MPVYRIGATHTGIPQRYHFYWYTAAVPLIPVYRSDTTHTGVPQRYYSYRYTAAVPLILVYPSGTNFNGIPQRYLPYRYTAAVPLLPVYRCGTTHTGIPQQCHSYRYTVVQHKAIEYKIRNLYETSDAVVWAIEQPPKVYQSTYFCLSPFLFTLRASTSFKLSTEQLQPKFFSLSVHQISLYLDGTTIQVHAQWLLKQRYHLYWYTAVIPLILVYRSSTINMQVYRSGTTHTDIPQRYHSYRHTAAVPLIPVYRAVQLMLIYRTVLYISTRNKKTNCILF